MAHGVVRFRRYAPRLSPADAMPGGIDRGSRQTGRRAGFLPDDGCRQCRRSSPGTRARCATPAGCGQRAGTAFCRRTASGASRGGVMVRTDTACGGAMSQAALSGGVRQPARVLSESAAGMSATNVRGSCGKTPMPKFTFGSHVARVAGCGTERSTVACRIGRAASGWRRAIGARLQSGLRGRPGRSFRTSLGWRYAKPVRLRALPGLKRSVSPVVSIILPRRRRFRRAGGALANPGN